MEAFEKELNEARAKDEGEDADGEKADDFDEAELGDDPFARSGEAISVDTEGEAWLGSDRDYTYSEVGAIIWLVASLIDNILWTVAPPAFLRTVARVEPGSSQYRWKATYTCAATADEGRKQENRIWQHRRYLQAYASTTRAYDSVHVC
jgi:hypothetical protein